MRSGNGKTERGKYVAPSRRHHRKRIRRTECGQGAQARQRRRHPDLEDNHPPVPATAVPGGHRDIVRRRHRPDHQAGPAQAEERPGVVGRSQRDRPEGEDGHVAPDGHADRDALRQSHRGRRRPAVLFRPRRLRHLRARHEEHRRRPGAARPHPRRVRGRRGRHRPGRAATPPDLRGGRCRVRRASSWPARSSNSPSAPWPGHSGPSRPASAGSSCWTRRPRCCRRWVPNWASRRNGGWKRWASRSSSTRW